MEYLFLLVYFYESLISKCKMKQSLVLYGCFFLTEKMDVLGLF